MSDLFTNVAVGLHLFTAHAPAPTGEAPALNDNNPGIYIVADTPIMDGLTAGAYRNSYKRLSLYAGKTWRTDRFALLVGVATGYKNRTLVGQYVCRDGYTDHPSNHCTVQHGATSAWLRPMVAPSIVLHEAQQYIGVAPRLAIVGAKDNKPHVHLSIEHRF